MGASNTTGNNATARSLVRGKTSGTTVWFLIPVSLLHATSPSRALLMYLSLWSSSPASQCRTGRPTPLRTAISCARASSSDASFVVHAGAPTLLKILRYTVIFLQLRSFVLTFTWLRASWSAGSPRLRRARIDRPVYMSGGAFTPSLPRASSTSGTVSLAPTHDCV